ncbi:hypothetical protein J6590_070444 [Homalodisca vitripennis]|nr:hypothetical protein J6590_070444 [Homalodisca vitripennis]
MHRTALLAVVCGCVVAHVHAQGQNSSVSQDLRIQDRLQDRSEPRLGVVTNSYYDFLINEASYKFWAVFQFCVTESLYHGRTLVCINGGTFVFISREEISVYNEKKVVYLGRKVVCISPKKVLVFITRRKLRITQQKVYIFDLDSYSQASFPQHSSTDNRNNIQLIDLNFDTFGAIGLYKRTFKVVVLAYALTDFV